MDEPLATVERISIEINIGLDTNVRDNIIYTLLPLAVRDSHVYAMIPKMQNLHAT